MGFINSETWLFAFIPFGIPAAFLGSASYVLLLLFYSPVVVSNAFLLEPFFAQALGYAFGLDDIPGVATFIGTSFAVLGIWYLEKGNKERIASEAIENDSDFEKSTYSKYSY